MQHLSICRRVTLLNTERAAVNLHTLASIIFGDDTESVLALDKAIFVLERTRLPFLYEDVELKLIGVFPNARIYNLSALFIGGYFIPRSGSNFCGVLLRSININPRAT